MHDNIQVEAVKLLAMKMRGIVEYLVEDLTLLKDMLLKFFEQLLNYINKVPKCHD
jgi:hypothetical protein